MITMPGERSLDKLLSSLKVTLLLTTYVFLSLPAVEAIEALPVPVTDIRMWFWESEGATLIIPLETAQRLQLDFSYRCKMITLEVHSSLEAVGFMAAIATGLAAAGLSSNPVSGYYHDHLFVKEEEAEKAVAVLEDMAKEANAVPSP
jgi:hypothetical protein